MWVSTPCYEQRSSQQHAPWLTRICDKTWTHSDVWHTLSENSTTQDVWHSACCTYHSNMHHDSLNESWPYPISESRFESASWCKLIWNTTMTHSDNMHHDSATCTMTQQLAPIGHSYILHYLKPKRFYVMIDVSHIQIRQRARMSRVTNESCHECGMHLYFA